MKSAKRTVLMVCSQYPPIYGGAGAQAALLGTHLSRLGWSVEAVTLDQRKIGSSETDGVVVSRYGRMEPVGRFKSLITTVVLSLGASWRVMRTRPSVVHVHGIYWWTILPVAVGRALGAATVIKSTRDGEDDPLTVVSKRLGPFAVGKLYGLSLRMASRIVVLNQSALDSAVQAGYGEKTVVMRNGVDSERLARTEERRKDARETFGLTDSDVVVTFVGYLVPHKGVLDLLAAASRMEEEDVQFWLVGPSAGFYRELTDEVPEAIAAAESSGVRVVQFGHRSGAEMPPIYWATDVFVLPSYAEGMPNSLAEAMIAGCRIVSTSIPGVVDLFDENDSVVLVKPGAVEDLAAALRAQIRGASQSVESAAKRIKMSNVVIAYSRLYEEIVAQ